MSSFASNLKIIPRPAWIVGILLAAVFTLTLVLGPFRFDEEIQTWPLTAKLGLLVLPVALIPAYALLTGFIYADAKRRQMRHVMWAWLALVPYFIGVILYFIFRNPLPTPCPRCSTDVPRAFAFCPGCGASVHPICAQCAKPLQWEWSNCPHCGSRVAST